MSLWREKNKKFLFLLLGSLVFLCSLFFYQISGNGLEVRPDINSERNEKDKNEKDKEEKIWPELPMRPPLVLLFGGDVMLSRTVNAKMAAYDDYEWPFAQISQLTSSADITIFNLESPFLKDADYNVPSGSFMFKADPKAIIGLQAAGVDVLSLANNHIMNMGDRGLDDTLSILQMAGIGAVGAGQNEKAARQGYLWTGKGWKVAFLSYAYPDDNSVAGEKKPGISTMDVDNLREDIARWRHQADLVIVLMHAGTEYVSSPNKEQVTFARAAIDAGADAVIGHHPHWPQSWEIYQNKPIFYSLGNLVFDQMWSRETSQGLLARLTFNDNFSGQAELWPIIISDYGQAQLWPEAVPESIFWDAYDLPIPADLSWSALGGN
jgi:poly-gamma-glutamate synthesis protein (capsule biosynthesis protein)